MTKGDKIYEAKAQAKALLTALDSRIFAYCFIKNFTVMLIKFAAAAAAAAEAAARGDAKKKHDWNMARASWLVPVLEERVRARAGAGESKWQLKAFCLTFFFSLREAVHQARETKRERERTRALLSACRAPLSFA